MKKLMLSLASIFIAMVFLHGTAHSQDLSAAEKNTLCQKEKQNLDDLNEKLHIIAFKIPWFKDYVTEMTAYLQQSLKYDQEKLDRGIALCLIAQKHYKESLDRTVAGSVDQLRHKYQLENLEIKLDYLTEMKARRLIGETVDPKSNDLQKAITRYKNEIDQLEDSKKYLTNDVTMNKGRISRLSCDDKTTPVAKKEGDTKPGTNLTEDQKQDRCQNNKNRIAELEKQARVINADLSFAWSKREIQDAKDNMTFLKPLQTQNYLLNIDKHQVEEIARKYEFDWDDCVNKIHKEFCLGSLERTIGEKVARAKSLNRLELLAKQKEIETQISNHRTNLIALGCDKTPKNNNEEFIKKLIGAWTEKPTPWGPGGGCQIRYTNGKLSLVNENGKESGASASVNSDGSGSISASDWPVSGKINKAVNSIKWSNGSEWVR